MNQPNKQPDEPQASSNYHGDVVAWANQQAALLRAGRLDQLDIENIAEEIEDVGRSERRELENHMSILIGHLLKWCYQPAKRSKSWQGTIKTQRLLIARRVNKMPSLKVSLRDDDWLLDPWISGRNLASQETGLDLEAFPAQPHWSVDQLLDDKFWPDE